MWREPKHPKPPGREAKDCGEFGRVTTFRQIAYWWHCRWCRSEMQLEGAAVICVQCDRTGVPTQEWVNEP